MNAPDEHLRRDRAVAAMNRGFSAMGNDDHTSLESALDDYERAITELRTLPVADNPGWANSLGAALMNRGQLLHRMYGINRAGDALDSYFEAITVLTTIPEGAQTGAHRNLAGTHLNRSNLLLDLQRPDEAREDAQVAIALVCDSSNRNLVDAELCLKARRSLCDALGELVAQDGADQSAIADHASDVVDDSLALVRQWEASGCDRFRALAIRLFCFGAELYRRHQPHFLCEFVFECVKIDQFQPDAIADELISIARQKLTLALEDCDATRFNFVGDPETERRAETRHQLLLALERIENYCARP